MAESFSWHLRHYGPEADYPRMDLARARSYCKRLARSHYENFTVASLWLPRSLMPHFYAVYAYCRWADDLADESGGGATALALLRWWREQLLACYDGEARHPVFVALRATIDAFDIPARPFLDLLFAFEQDQLVKRYRTYEQLLEYCRYSANPVGHLVLYLCDSYNEANAVFSDHICTALQLTNFWQDVRRDLDIGRVYLPDDERLLYGYGETDLQTRTYTPAFAEMMAFLVQRTRDLFYRGMPLVDRVPREVQPDVELFVRGGLAILRKIERLRYDVWHTRPRLSALEKGWLVTRTVKDHLSRRLAELL